MLMGHHDEPDSRGTLTRDHGAPGKEDFMEAVSTLGVILDNLLLVFDEVVIPHLDSVSVMNSLVSYSLNLEATTFNLVNVPVERARGVCSWEDVLTHEDAPE